MNNEIDRLLGSSGSVIYPGLGSPAAGEPTAEQPGAQPRPPATAPEQPPQPPAESDVDPPQDGEPGLILPAGWVEPAPGLDADPQRRRYQRWRTASALAALGATALFVLIALLLALILPRLPHRAQPAAAPGPEPVRSSAPAAGELPGSESSAASPSADTSVNPATGQPSPQPVGAGGPAPFQPVSYEAEAPENVLSGSAVIQAYPGASGGAVVTDPGSTMDGAAAASLTFTAVEVPATGRYTLVVSYLYPAPVSGAASRLVVTVGGSAPVTVPVPPGPQAAACCATRPVPVTLRAGVDSITLGNPSGAALAIDRIVVTR